MGNLPRAVEGFGFWVKGVGQQKTLGYLSLTTHSLSTKPSKIPLNAINSSNPTTLIILVVAIMMLYLFLNPKPYTLLKPFRAQEATCGPSPKAGRGQGGLQRAV